MRKHSKQSSVNYEGNNLLDRSFRFVNDYTIDNRRHSNKPSSPQSYLKEKFLTPEQSSRYLKQSPDKKKTKKVDELLSLNDRSGDDDDDEREIYKMIIQTPKINGEDTGEEPLD